MFGSIELSLLYWASLPLLARISLPAGELALLRGQGSHALISTVSLQY
uniref:Uncharacterized protein n=1 Tax=Arundo donax TaxID=35708 RepID=A0A0A9U1X0_ARUDO